MVGWRVAKGNPPYGYLRIPNNQRVHRYDLAAGADQRVDVQFRNTTRLVGGEFGDAGKDFRESVQIDRGKIAEAFE